MSVIKGDAGFKYGAGPTTHALGAPAYFERYGTRRRRYTHQPIDYSVAPDRFTIGTASQVVTAVFRFDTDPGSLTDMMGAAADDGEVLTYYPSLADTLTSYDFTIIEVGDLIEVQRDRQFPDTYFQMWEVTVRLRTDDDISALLTP